MEPHGQLLLGLGGPPKTILISGAALAVVIALFGWLVLWLRRKMASPLPDDTFKGFSINNLEAMHQSGQLSREEFQRLRRAALGLSGAPLGPSSGGGDDADAEATTENADEANCTLRHPPKPDDSGK